jgi:hypothetical protein
MTGKMRLPMAIGKHIDKFVVIYVLKSALVKLSLGFANWASLSNKNNQQ